MRFFFLKQKTAYEMRISDWSSDVCSSDLGISDRPSINPSSRPPDAVFCASGAHVLERTLRSGSRKPRHAARPAELLDGLPRSRKPMTDMTTTATESSYKADELIAADIDEIGRAQCRERVCT